VSITKQSFTNLLRQQHALSSSISPNILDFFTVLTHATMLDYVVLCLCLITKLGHTYNSHSCMNA